MVDDTYKIEMTGLSNLHSSKWQLTTGLPKVTQCRAITKTPSASSFKRDSINTQLSDTLAGLQVKCMNIVCVVY